MVAYFAGLRDKVGIHGQAFAIERYFSKGVPATLRDAPPSGLEGMAPLRNRLELLDSPQSIQPIKDALLHIYGSEIQQVQIQSEKQADWGDPIRKLVYPEITGDNLDYWRQLVEQSNAGPVRNLYTYKVGTVWFGIQEFRQQTYVRWTEILQERGIYPAEEAFTMQAAPEGDYRQRPESIGVEAYGPDAIYLNVHGIPPAGRTEYQAWLASLDQPIYALFMIQQRLGIISELGLGFEVNVDWEAYVQSHVSEVTGAYGEALRVLGSIFGMTPEQREQAGLTFGTEASGNIEELQGLVELVLRKTNSYSAALLASRIPGYRRAWAGAGESEAFLDYLRSELGIDPAEEGLPAAATGWTTGRFLLLYIPDAEKVDQIGYIDQNGEHFILTPQEAGNTLAAVSITVVNPKSSRVLLSMDKDSVSLSDPKGNRYPMIDPFANAKPVASPIPEEGKHSPFLWGALELQKDYQVQGWVVFEVPSDFKAAVLLWEETESIRAQIGG